MLDTILDLKNTFEGKFLAVLMSVVLVMSMTNVLAFAGSEEGQPADETAAADQEPVLEEPAADGTAQPAAEEAAPQGEEADAGAADAPTLPSEPPVTATVDEAVVAFEVANAYVSVSDQVLSGKILTTELHKELRFSAHADTGFEVAAVTAKNAANAEVPVITQDGVSVIAAEHVDSTLVVTVTADPAGGEGSSAPAVETEPITSDTKITADEADAEAEDGSAADEPLAGDAPADDEVVEVEADVSDPAFEGYAVAGGVTVKVTAGEGVLPEGTLVRATPVERQDVVDAVAEKIESRGKVLENAVAIDVTLLDADGNEIQPDGAVNVCFFDSDVEGEEIGVYRVSDDASAVETIGARQADADVQSFDVDHFTIYVISGEGEQQTVEKVMQFKTVALGETVRLTSKQENGAAYLETRNNAWTMDPAGSDVVSLEGGDTNELSVTGETLGTITLVHAFEYRTEAGGAWTSAREPVQVTVVGADIPARAILYDKTNTVVGEQDVLIASGSLAGQAPSFGEYRFVQAVVGDVVITSVEKRADGIYYSVDSSLGQGVGVKLGDDEEIELQYRALDNEVLVHYTTSGSIDVEGNAVVGFPQVVETGSDFSFKVLLARGYESKVTLEGEVLEPDGSNTYTVPEVTGETTVNIEFKKLERVSFDTSWWGTTENTRGRYGMIDPQDPAVVRWADVGDSGARFDFLFQTDMDQGVTWQLDSFNINGIYLAMPSRDIGSQASTTLYSDASGACVATVSVLYADEWKGRTSYVYNVSVTGAKENLRVEFANLNNITWAEVVPTADEGIAFSTRDGEGLNWPYQTVGRTPSFTFSLEEGYKNLSVNMTAFNSAGDLLFEKLGVSLPAPGEAAEIRGPGSSGVLATIASTVEGEYTITYASRSGNAKKDTVVLQKLNLTCEKSTYGIVYDAKEGTGRIVDPLSYDVVGNATGVVTSQVPAAPAGKLFAGWTIEGDTSGTVYFAGDKIDFSDPAMRTLLQADDANDGNLVFEASYANELPNGQAITVPVQVYMMDVDGTYVLDESKSFGVKSGADKDVVYLNIPIFAGYVYNAGMSTATVPANGTDAIQLYYDRAVHTVTYKVIGDYFADDSFSVETMRFGAPLTLIGDDMERPGYEWSGWSGLPAVMPDADVVVTGSYKPSSSTPYTVEYYLQNLEGNGYVLEESASETLTGMTGKEVRADIKEFTGFSHNGDVEGTLLSGIVEADGSLMLKVYYDRDVFQVVGSIDGHGTIEGPAKQSVRYQGASTAMTFRAEDGYRIVSVTVNGETVLAEPGTTAYVFDAVPSVERNYEVVVTTAAIGKVVAVAPSATKTYDGAPIEYGPAQFSGLPAGYTATAKVEGSQVDAGWSFTNIVAGSIVIRDASGAEVTDNFEVGTEQGKLTVEQREVTLTSADDSKVYDGTPLVNDTITVIGTFVEGQEPSYEVTGSATYVTDTREGNNTFAYRFPAGVRAENYKVAVNFGTLAIEAVEHVVVTVAGHSVTQTYDATEHSVDGYDVVSISNALYTEGDFAFDGTAEAARTNVGTTTMGLTGASFSNQNPNFADVVFKVEDGKIRIDPAKLVIEPVSTGKTYGEEDPVLTAEVFGLQGLDTFAGSYDVVREAGEAPGEYALTVENAVPGTDNYTIETRTGRFVIVPAGGLVISVDAANKVYDGTPLVPDSFTVSGLAAGDYIADVVFGGSQTDAGESSGTVESYVIRNAAGEDVTGSYSAATVNPGILLVTPAHVVIAVADASKTYGEGDPAFTGAIEGLVGDDSLGEVTYSRTDDVEAVGTYPGILNATVADLNPNYTYEVAPGTFVITPAAGNVVNIDTEGLVKTYDGIPSSVRAEASQPGSTLLYSLNGVDWSPDNPVFTDAGSYPVYVKAVNPDYEETPVAAATVVIDKAPVTITVADASKVYGAKDPTFAGSVTGLVAEGDLGTVTYRRTNGDENVGTYPGALTATYAENANYEVTVVDGAFAITPQAIAADDPADVVYNGREQAWSPVVTGENGQTLVEGEDYTVVYSEDILNAGTVTVTIQGAGNYAGTVDRSYEITPAPAVIRVNDASKRFDEDDPAFTGAVEGLFGEDSLGDVTYIRTNDDEAVGTYEGVLTATVENANPNYTFTVVPGAFAISSSDANVVRIASDAEGLIKTYDGQPVSVSATADVEGSTLLYSVDGGATWSDENPSFTDAGTYTVQVKATHEGYEETAPVSATVVINKAPVAIVVDDASKVYGAADPVFTGTVEGLVAEGDLGEIGYVRVGGAEDVGVYANALTALFDPNPNYAVTVANGTFTITAAPATPTPIEPTPATPPVPTAPDATAAPTPGTPPADNPLTPVIAPVVDVLANAAEAVIGDNETPLAQNAEPREAQIGDNETPLAGAHARCWVHWYIILGIIVTAVYAACVALRRGLFSRKLKKYEDEVTGGGDPAPGAPSADDDAKSALPKNVPATATFVAGSGQ